MPYGSRECKARVRQSIITGQVLHTALAWAMRLSFHETLGGDSRSDHFAIDHVAERLSRLADLASAIVTEVVWDTHRHLTRTQRMTTCPF